jgi:diguanylate cyclase (GGDEF)-like protein
VSVIQTTRRLVGSGTDLLWHGILRLERLPRAVNLAVGLAIVALITVADALTGSAAGFEELYLLPIVFVAWLTRSTASGVAVALLATALRLGTTLATGSASPARAISGAVLHALLYMSVVMLLGLFRRDRDVQKQLAVTDALTGVANRRAFYATAQRELDRSRRYGHHLSLLYVDVDDFKRVNDVAGHDQGDRVLRTLAAVAQSSVRSIDFVARLGGDEFVVLLPETSSGEAGRIARRLRTDLDGAATFSGYPITCSVGVVTYRDLPQTVDDLLRAADATMYEAKTGGRNRISATFVGGSK